MERTQNDHGIDVAPGVRRVRPARTLTALGAVTVLGLLAACTGPEQPPSVSTPTASATSEPETTASDAPAAPTVDTADEDACALLPPDAVAERLGVEVTATPIPSDGWIAGQCAWSGEGVGFILSVGTEDAITAAGDPAEMDAETKLSAFAARQGADVREVADIGDGAFGGPSSIAARVGGTYLELEVLSLPAEQVDEIMRLAVSTLEG